MANNVTRLLDSRKIPYRLFELPKEKLGASETAEILQVPISQVFKTIVIIRQKPGKPILAVVPGDSQVDLKAVAKLVNEKKVSLPTEKEAESLTGLEAGGISPLALINSGFQVLIDQQANDLGEIHISGGERGINLRLGTKDLVQLTRARFGIISVPMDETGEF